VADVLSAIVASSRRAAAERARALPLEALARKASVAAPRGALFEAQLAEPGVRIIAECKRRSPSRGILRADFDPAAIAKGYERAGAAAISVLTEPSFFDGSIAHLQAVRSAVQVPVLRKDFIVTEYQVVEARAIGADAVLLIVAALEQPELEALLAAAAGLDLAALVEVHTAEELRRAAAAGARIIGVNGRNLRTLTVDLGVFDALRPDMPPGSISVAESGLRSADDLRRLRASGYSAFLIGERFMTEDDPGAALGALRHAAESSEVRG
jgi:indole-3-glycerol phosphate synthase